MAKKAAPLSFEVTNGPGMAELVDALKYAYRGERAAWAGEDFTVDFTVRHPDPAHKGLVRRLRITGLQRDKGDRDTFYFRGETDLSMQFAVGDEEVSGVYDTRQRTGTLIR